MFLFKVFIQILFLEFKVYPKIIFSNVFILLILLNECSVINGDTKLKFFKWRPRTLLPQIIYSVFLKILMYLNENYNELFLLIFILGIIILENGLNKNINFKIYEILLDLVLV